MRFSWLRRNMALSLAAVVMVSSCAELAYATDNKEMTEEKDQSLEKLRAILEKIGKIEVKLGEVNNKLSDNGADGILEKVKALDKKIEEEAKPEDGKEIEEKDKDKEAAEVENQESEKQEVENKEIEDNKDEKMEDAQEDIKTDQDINQDTDKSEITNQKDIQEDNQDKNQEESENQTNQEGTRAPAGEGERVEEKNIDENPYKRDGNPYNIEENNTVYKNKENLLAYKGEVLLAKADPLRPLEPNLETRGRIDNIIEKIVNINNELNTTYNNFINIAIEIQDKKDNGIDFNNLENLEIKEIRRLLADQVREIRVIKEGLNEIEEDLDKLGLADLVIKNYMDTKSISSNRFQINQKLDSIDKSFSDLSNKNIREIKDENDLKYLENVDLAILEDTIEIKSIGQITGKSGGSRFILKESNLSKPFLNIEKADLEISNVSFDGAGNHGGLEVKEDNLSMVNVSFINNNRPGNIIDSNNLKISFSGSTSFINNRARNIVYSENSNGQLVFEGKTIFQGNIADGDKDKEGNIIYSNNNDSKITGLRFKGDIDFIENNANNIIHNHTTTSQNGEIVFEEDKTDDTLNFFDNHVRNSIILNNRFNKPVRFNIKANFIGNKGLKDTSIMISHTEGTMEFKAETKIIANDFEGNILYNGVAENKDVPAGAVREASKMEFKKLVVMNNRAKNVVVDEATNTLVDNGIEIAGQKIIDSAKNVYNQDVYRNLIVLGNIGGESILGFIEETSTRRLPNMKKEFSFNPNGGSLNGKNLFTIKDLKDLRDPSREKYSFIGWSPSVYRLKNISYRLSKSSREIAGTDFLELYAVNGVRSHLAQWEKDQEPSTGGGGRDRDKNKDKDKPKEEEKKPEEKIEPMIDGRPVSELIKDYENASGEAKRELRELLMGVTIEEGLEYKFKKEEHAAYMQGYSDNTFKPDEFVTREEAASVVMRILEPRFVEEVETTDHKFKDVEAGRWSERAIATLANGEIMNGYGDGTFKPDRYITRAELSRTVSRFTDIIIEETKFEDIIAHWAEDYINSAKREGWIKGYDDGSFKPDSLITRAELTALINSMLERRVNREHILQGAKIYSDLEYDKWYYPVIMEAINGHNHDVNEYRDGTEIWVDLTEDIFF